MAEPTHPTVLNHSHPVKYPVKCERPMCFNEVALTSKSKRCQDCLDTDSARKQNKTLEELREKRASDEQRREQEREVLNSKGLGRLPAPKGYHHCYGCHKDLPDVNFDLSKSRSRCINHLASRMAGEEAAAEKKKGILLPSSNAAAVASTVTEVDVEVHREEFSTFEAALEHVEILGHKEHVMYVQRSEDRGTYAYRCHCFDKHRDKRPRMCCYPLCNRICP